MIQRAWQMLTTEVSGMHAAALVLASSAFISALLALVRDRLLAHTFGAGLELDIYYAAFRVPDLIFVLVASLFSAYVLIPELARRLDIDSQKRYIDTIVVGFSLIMGVVSFIVYLWTPQLLEHLFPQLYASVEGETLVTLTRLLLLQPILLGFSNILAAITQHAQRYLLYALAPIVYNLGIIIGVVVLYPTFGLSGVGIGVVLGAFLHAFIQIPSIAHAGFVFRLPRPESFSTLWTTVMVSLPRTLALSSSQLVVLGLLVLGGALREGSVAVFSLALNLQAVPLAIIGASYSVAAFPTLARMAAEGSHAQFVQQVVNAARHILFWTFPAIALLIILRAHLVRTVLGTGAFDWTDTRLTSATLALLACALVAQALTLLIARGYYAAERSFVPFITSALSGIGTLVLGYVLIVFFGDREILRFVEELLRVSDVPGIEMLALPFAYSVGAIIGAIVLIVLFERDFGGFVGGVARTFWESVTAAGIGGAVAYGVLTVLGGISSATTFGAVITYGALSGTTGLLAILITYFFLGSKELKEIYSAFAQRGKATAPLQSAEENLA